MQQQSYTRSQLLTLGLIVALTPALRLFPAESAAAAGRAAWLTPLAALPLGWGWLYLLRRVLALREPGEDLPQLALRLLGPRAGRVAAAALGFWALGYTAFVLRAGAERLVCTVYPHAAPRAFLPVTGALALCGALAGRRSLVRMARLLRPLLLGVPALLFLFTLPQLRLDNLWPVTRADLWPVVKGALPALDIVTGAGLAMSFLVGGTRERPGAFRALAGWAAALSALLTALALAVTGCLGAEIAAELTHPFFALVRTLVLFGSVERVEALVVMLWIFPDFLCAAVFLGAGQRCLRLLPKRSGSAPDARGEGWLTAACALAVTGLALVLAPQPQLLARLSTRLIPAVNLALCFTLIPLLYIVGRKKQAEN